MKFQPDRLDGVNTINRIDGPRIWVNGEVHESSLLVPWRGAVLRWQPDAWEQLDAAHFDDILALKPELVIFGSGTRLRFVAPALYRSLIERRIGIETMDTLAACRTFTVLANEGRTVVAALLSPRG